MPHPLLFIMLLTFSPLLPMSLETRWLGTVMLIEHPLGFFKSLMMQLTTSNFWRLLPVTVMAFSSVLMSTLGNLSLNSLVNSKCQVPRLVHFLLTDSSASSLKGSLLESSLSLDMTSRRASWRYSSFPLIV